MKINLDHWFVNNNGLSISLMNFYVNIDIVKNDEFIYYPLIIHDSEKKTLLFNFYALDDAISFTESINKYFTLDEVLQTYIIEYGEGKYKTYKRSKQ